MSLHQECLPDPLPPEPLALVARWLAEAYARGLQPNPNAMVLATVDRQGWPAARVVLCKEIEPDPGYLTFFTNYRSRKGAELESVPRAAIVMHWDALHRQVRIEGPVVRTTAADSDAYFATRTWQSRVGAWASHQSLPVASRAALIASVEATAERLGTPSPIQNPGAMSHPGVPIARPPYWGGYRIWAEVVELWVEGQARIHDRARWTRRLDAESPGFAASAWSATRLQP
jgi:pyridoxamine 5'-phosphate oxidase